MRTWFSSVLERRPVTVALLLLAVCALTPFLYCEYRLRSSGAHPDRNQKMTTLTEGEFAKLVARADKQKDQRSEWAYAALVAIVAISVLKKARNIPWGRYAYLLLGTAGVYMFESIRAGDEYERTVASLMLMPAVEEAEFNLMNDLLWLQLSWLNVAAGMLLLFVAVFLVAVLSGKVQLEALTND